MPGEGTDHLHDEEDEAAAHLEVIHGPEADPEVVGQVAAVAIVGAVLAATAEVDPGASVRLDRADRSQSSDSEQRKKDVHHCRLFH